MIASGLTKHLRNVQGIETVGFLVVGVSDRLLGSEMPACAGVFFIEGLFCRVLYHKMRGGISDGSSMGIFAHSRIFLKNFPIDHAKLGILLIVF